MRKAEAVGADAVVFDLEDAVPADVKLVARAEVVRLLGEDRTSSSSVHVRVNATDGGFDGSDIDAVVWPGIEALRLPKCESALAVANVEAQLDRLESERGIAPGSVWLYPTIESARGVLVVDELAAASPRVAALIFGPADFSASLGVSELTFEATLVARSLLCIASAAAGIGRPIDGAFRDVDDLEGLELACRRARELGFAGKSAIHPRQVVAIQRAFTPSDRELAWARRVLSESRSGTVTGVVDGSFIDPAAVKQATAVLALADRTATRGSDDA